MDEPKTCRCRVWLGFAPVSETNPRRLNPAIYFECAATGRNAEECREDAVRQVKARGIDGVIRWVDVLD